MKKLLIALIAIITLASCSNFGKKIKIEGTKGEVYYKGDGVTEEDAKKTGAFLKEQGFFNNDKGASVQISKDNDAYIMRFVYDKDVYDTLKNVDKLFKLLAVRASKDLFNGKQVNISLANKMFKEYKTLAYDESVAKEFNEYTDDNIPPGPSDDDPTTDRPLTKEDFEHDKAGGIDFYWLGLTDAESKKIADYIVAGGAFSDGGTPQLWMTKENGRVIIRYPLIASAQTNESVMTQMDILAKDLKQNLFADIPFSFQATDENLRTVRSFDY